MANLNYYLRRVETAISDMFEHLDGQAEKAMEKAEEIEERIDDLIRVLTEKGIVTEKDFES